MNAFYIRGEAVGEHPPLRPGGGDDATGTAVVSDVIELARNVSAGISERCRRSPFATTPSRPSRPSR